MKRKKIISVLALSAVVICGISFFRTSVSGLSANKTISYTVEDMINLQDFILAK